MSLAGLKKQFNKANQKTDVMNELVEELITKTREMLQPNAATRLKMTTTAYVGRIAGTGQGATGANAGADGAQPEADLAETMSKHGRALGDHSVFGKALMDSGDALSRISDGKSHLEETVRQNFIDPLVQLQNKDLKEVLHHRKKLQGRRLDYDCKKRNRGTDVEMMQAEDKLEESKRLAETAMFNLLDNDVEQISQLSALVEAELDFHRQAVDVLQGLSKKLQSRVQEASGRPHEDHVPKTVLNGGSRSSRSRSPVPDGRYSSSGATTPAHGGDMWNANASGGGGGGSRDPSAVALFDFEPENEGELGLKEGQTVALVSQIDENWYEGRLPNGKAGYFPVNYVRIVVPLK